jgi:hypothetical protein
MPASRTFGKGSKRTIARIRWKRSEVIHLVVLFVILIIFSVFVAVWFGMHHFD